MAHPSFVLMNKRQDRKVWKVTLRRKKFSEIYYWKLSIHYIHQSGAMGWGTIYF